MKKLADVFRDLALADCEVLSSNIYTSEDAPPVYAAHLMIQRREYVLTMVPTDLPALQGEESEG